MSKGILLDDDDDNELKVNVRRDSNGLITGGLITGERTMQDAYIVLAGNQGDVKEDPITGANLLRMIRGKADIEKIRKTVEIALARVKIRLDDIKNQLDIIINKISV
jgi:hypothetical protein